MNFVDAVVAFLNIGIFSTLICRFTGANMAMLVFCALLYMGSEPMETVGIMLTYLVFMRLTIYTQKRKLNFKKLQVFKGMRVFVPVLLIVISLFLYPFAALAIFLLLFMVEILAQIKAEIPEDRQLSKGELTKYIVIGSLLTTVSMIAVKFIPAAWYYALGGAVGLFLCGFVWWLGQDRDRLSGIWDTVILLSFIPLGLFGFDMADWMDDMRRSVNPTRIAYNLPFIFLPVFYVGFLMANILFGVFSLSGMCITFFGALGLRLFGYYEMSGKGKASLIAIGIACLTAVYFGVPVLFAKKSAGSNMDKDVYATEVKSFTHNKVNHVVASKKYLNAGEHILIMDDFLANGCAVQGLIDLVKQAGGIVEGVGICIEKGFQGGGDELRASGIDVKSLAIIEKMDAETGTITFR